MLRAKLYEQSSESDVEAIESENSSEEEDSNWHILSQIWPVSDRPPALQSRRVVNNKSMEELTAIFRMKTEKDKLEGSGDISVDAKQPTIVFQKKSDDGQSKLHPARWLRLPTSDPSTWCAQVPLKTTPIIRHMALGYSGSQVKRMFLYFLLYTPFSFVLNKVLVAAEKHKTLCWVKSTRDIRKKYREKYCAVVSKNQQ